MRRCHALVITLFVLICIGGCVAPERSPVVQGAAAARADGTNIARAAVEPLTFGDLDPSSACTSELWVLINAYETLTRYAPPGSAAPLAPGLATAWTVSADGLTWTFQLRGGVKFHDGADFDASAVKFSIERTRRIGQCAAYLFDPVAEIQTPDPHTVVFKLAYPAPLDAILASPYSAWIMSPAAADKDAAWFAAGHEAGTGPYRFAQYEPGQRLVAERFGEYWGGWQRGQFDTIIFELLADNVAAEQMLRAGELDFANQIILTPEQLGGLDGQAGLRLDAAPGVGNSVIFLNHRRAPTDDVRVRQALAYSFPYAAVVANTMLGRGTLAHGAVPTGVWGHDPAPAGFVEDLDKARELLATAGYPDGLELTFSYDPTEQTLAELWRANLARIGVTLRLEPADFSIRWEAARSAPEAAPEAFLLGWAPDVVDPYSYLFNMFHSEKQPLWNLGFYGAPAFDALVDEARQQSATDQAGASEKYVAAQQMLADDAAAIYALENPDLNVIAVDIEGFVSNPAYPHLAYWYDLRRGK